MQGITEERHPSSERFMLLRRTWIDAGRNNAIRLVLNATELTLGFLSNVHVRDTVTTRNKVSRREASCRGRAVLRRFVQGERLTSRKLMSERGKATTGSSSSSRIN